LIVPKPFYSFRKPIKQYKINELQLMLHFMGLLGILKVDLTIIFTGLSFAVQLIKG